MHNEERQAIEGATLTLSGTAEILVADTNPAGLAVLWPLATVTDSYELLVDKTGFAQTVTDVPVQVIPDTVPPWLYLDAPAATNRTPLAVTGGVETGAAVTVNTQSVTVDAEGLFATTVTLSEGSNLLTTIATDAADNSTIVIRTVILDTVAPALTLTTPHDGFSTDSDVVAVTGSTEAGASLTVDGTLGTVRPDGSFSAWALLRPGENVITVVATDAASNSTTVIRTVTHRAPEERGIYLPPDPEEPRTHQHQRRSLPPRRPRPRLHRRRRRPFRPGQMAFSWVLELRTSQATAS